jgi:hypothetical protein
VSDRPSASKTWLWPLLAMAGVAITIVPRLRWVNLYEDQAVLAGQAMQVASGQRELRRGLEWPNPARRQRDDREGRPIDGRGAD